MFISSRVATTDASTITDVVEMLDAETCAQDETLQRSELSKKPSMQDAGTSTSDEISQSKPSADAVTTVQELAGPNSTSTKNWPQREDINTDLNIAQDKKTTLGVFPPEDRLNTSDLVQAEAEIRGEELSIDSLDEHNTCRTAVATGNSNTKHRAQFESNGKLCTQDTTNLLAMSRPAIRNIFLSRYIPANAKEDKTLVDLKPLEYIHAYLALLLDFTVATSSVECNFRKLLMRFLNHVTGLSSWFLRGKPDAATIITYDQNVLFAVGLLPKCWDFHGARKIIQNEHFQTQPRAVQATRLSAEPELNKGESLHNADDHYSLSLFRANKELLIAESTIRIEMKYEKKRPFDSEGENDPPCNNDLSPEKYLMLGRFLTRKKAKTVANRD